MPSFPSGLGFAGNPARPLGRDPSPPGTEPARPRPQEISRKEAERPQGRLRPPITPLALAQRQWGAHPFPSGLGTRRTAVCPEEEEVDASFHGRGLVRGGHLKHNSNNCFL